MRLRISAGLVWALGCTLGFSQESKPAFEAISIRSAAMKAEEGKGRGGGIGASRGGPGTSDPERYHGNSVSITQLLLQAFDIQPYQLSAPDWASTTRFDVDAKVPAGASKVQFNLMLQKLLESRFSLKAHHKDKDFPAYNLVVVRRGPRLKEAAVAGAPGAVQPPRNAPCPAGRTPGMTSPGTLIPCRYDGYLGRAVPLNVLVQMLQNELDGPVVLDKTGLTGNYDLFLGFAKSGRDSEADPLPSIFTAVQEDLGLKLESAVTLVDMLIVDHVDKVPSSN